jgi:uncharacterized protein (TIGR02147 family)
MVKQLDKLHVVSVFQFNSYKSYFNAWVESQSNHGHGEYRRLSLALNVSTTLVSQVFKGEKDLSLELACDMAEYLHLNEEESDYLVLLVEFSKAGSDKLRTKFLKQIKNKQNEAKKLENRLKKDHVLNEEAKSIYCSSWSYPAIRMVCHLPGYNSAAEISERLKLPKNHVIKCLDFLFKNEILIQKDNNIEIGPAHIYLPTSSHLANRVHVNWRQLAFQKMQIPIEDNFFYSGNYALSKQVAHEIRLLLPEFIDGVLKKVKPSPSETTYCLNLDYFEF